MSTNFIKLEDRYEISKEIGDGLTATVFQAYDTVLEKKVAIKQLKQQENTCLATQVESFFKNEIDSLNKLCHNNIVKVVSHGKAIFNGAHKSEQASQFIALEYIEGVELVDFIMSKGALKESTAKHIFKQLLHAVKEIHDEGLVHRDIKSDNIMITDGCVPKILDFGFASTQSAEYNDGFFTTKLGTHAYMAPEIHNGERYRGVEVDLFALAIILFQMVVGRPPFESAKQNDFLYKCIKQNRPDIFWRQHKRYLPQDFVLSEEFKDLIISCLQTDPQSRPNLDQVMAHRWMQVTEEAMEEDLQTEFKERISLTQTQ